MADSPGSEEAGESGRNSKIPRIRNSKMIKFENSKMIKIRKFK